MKYKILMGMLPFLFCGCEKENNPCEIAKEGENYVLSDTAKTYVSNYPNADKIIFKTMAGDEIAFDIIKRDTIGSYQVTFPCQVDPLQGQTIKGTSQILSFELSNSMIISKPLIISVLEWPEIPIQQAQESLVVSYGKYFSSSFANGDLLFDFNINSNNPQLTYLDSLVIAGKTFYSVYETNYQGYIPRLEIKYSVNEGVVYIKDPLSSVEYIYERKE